MESFNYLTDLIIRIVEIIGYVWFALCLHIIARKLNARYPWLAWIPFANYYLMCKVGKKPIWWVAILCITPILVVALVFSSIAIIFMDIGGDGIPAWFYSLLLVTLIIGIISWVLFILIWMSISQERGRPSWFGILMIVPIANLVIPGILAFSEAPAQNIGGQ
jgi:hypothetical protein